MTEPLHALRFPFAVDPGSGQAAEESSYDAYVRQLIRQVLLTGQGERVNRPDFGAGIRRMVFAPTSPGVAALTETLVYQALSRWLGTVIRVEQVSVSSRETTLLVEVRYLVLARGESRVLTAEVTP